MSNEGLDDEALARQLQEEFNKEIEAAQNKSAPKSGLSPQEQLEADILLAKQLMEEEEKKAQGGAVKNETTNGAKGEASLEDLQKKQQEELDLLVAMKFQEELYATEEFKQKPPPPPQVYYPQNNFHRQKPEPNRLPPTAEAINRITSDLKEVLLSKNRDLNVAPDEDDICHIQSLIVGPPDTPYAYGFFHFDLIYPHDYPWKPPKVQLITTDSGRTRFNPNLYANGKVCLSILGTWSGPAWTSVQTILSTLLSIQSLMNPTPYHNEPGFEQERKPGDVVKYNQCIQHETIRVAVCGMMEEPTCGELFKDVMEELFLEHFDHYVSVCEQNAPLFDGKPMEDPFSEQRGNYKYATLLQRLHAIKEKIETRKKQEELTKKEEMEVEAPADSSNQPATATPETVQPMDTETPPAVATTTTQMETDEQEKKETTIQAQASTLAESILSALNSVKPVEGNQTNTTTTTTTSTTTQGNEAEIAKGIVNQYLSMISADEEFAKQLQEQEYGNQQSYYPKQNYTPYGGYQNTYEAQSYGASTYKPVKPPSMSELMKETNTKKDEADTITCLVCHGSPKEYIILPSCQQPHIYCMSCANKMIKQGPPQNRYNNYYNKKPQKRQSGQTIQCVLCSSVSSLDPTHGLSSLRRKKRRRTEDVKDKCPEHNEEYFLFCMDCMELVCYSCAGAHSKHNIEALDVAQNRVSRDLSSKLSTLDQKRVKLEKFIETVNTDKEKLKVASGEVLSDLKAKFDELRKAINDKEQELIDGIKKTESNKQANITNEITKAQQKIENINKSIQLVNSSKHETNPLTYLQKIEEGEENVRHCYLSEDPEVKARWFQLPPFNIQHIEHAVKALKYSDKMQMGFGMGGVLYSPDDDDSEDDSVVDDY